MPSKNKSSSTSNSKVKALSSKPGLEGVPAEQAAGGGAIQPEAQSTPAAMPPPIPSAPALATPSPSTNPTDPAWMFDPHLNDNLLPVNETTITLLRTSTYLMPGTCPVCNGQRAGGTGKLHTSNSYTSGRMRYTLSLDFPICQKCTDIQAFFSRRSKRAMLLGLPVGVLTLLVAIILSATSKNSSDSGNFICFGILGAFAVWGIASAMINAIINRNLPTALKERNKRLGPAVSISTFNPTHVSFKFGNNAYAAAFQMVNTAGSQNLVQQMLDTLKKKPS
jgi:hypothetical protein